MRWIAILFSSFIICLLTSLFIIIAAISELKLKTYIKSILGTFQLFENLF